jgi:hypothetical protein
MFSHLHKLTFQGPTLLLFPPIGSLCLSKWANRNWRGVLSNSLEFSITPRFPPTTCSPSCLLYADILLGFIFDTEDGCDMFLRKVCSLSLSYKALYPRIWTQQVTHTSLDTPPNTHSIIILQLNVITYVTCVFGKRLWTAHEWLILKIALHKYETDGNAFFFECRVIKF